jgi:DNA helicase-2/ATP-dependent DNA helicase PcrA
LASRFVSELPEKFIEKNSFFDRDKNEIEDFEFNQDVDFNDNDNIRSPGWIRYQKKLK